MYRTTCVICCNKLEKSYTHKNQPITYCPKPATSSCENDRFQDLEYGSCDTCESVQLMTLIPPEILYEDPHNITYNTPTWAQHHRAFAEFVKSDSLSGAIIEVGGSSGILATLLLGQFPDYTILDFCRADTIPPAVKYLQGNCETFDFPKGATLLMSHLFEHLYNPRRFIERAAEADTENIIISIPNLTHLLETGSPAVIHAEHTYYYDRADIEYMFSCYGYRISRFANFKAHSMFMAFTRGSSESAMKVSAGRAQRILETFRERDHKFSAIRMQTDALIVPAGIYGQLIYTHTKREGEIAGFLDNDPSKQGRRLYGTGGEIFGFDRLREMSSPKIYMHAGPYAAEISAQIRAIQPNAAIFEIL